MPQRRIGLGGCAVTAAITAAVLLLLGGCASGEDDPDLAAPPDSETTAGTGGLDETTTADSAPADDATTLVAQARGESIGVWSSPTEDDEADRTIRAADEASGQIVLLVKQELGPTWVEVYLPTAPSGSTGWVKRDDLTLSRHRFRIEVSRSTHTLTVYAGDVVALETPVAIGSSDAPPVGSGLFIKDLIETPDAAGPYGRYTYGLSGSSNRIEDFEAGAGVVGIHGTDDEGSLGDDVPTGSVAIRADALDRLVGSIGLPLGTPVEILP